MTHHPLPNSVRLSQTGIRREACPFRTGQATPRINDKEKAGISHVSFFFPFDAPAGLIQSPIRHPRAGRLSSSGFIPHPSAARRRIKHFSLAAQPMTENAQRALASRGLTLQELYEKIYHSQGVATRFRWRIVDCDQRILDHSRNLDASRAKVEAIIGGYL